MLAGRDEWTRVGGPVSWSIIWRGDFALESGKLNRQTLTREERILLGDVEIVFPS